jgi:signal transduction histidine kinase
MRVAFPGGARISHEGRYLIWAALAALIAITAALFLVDAEVERTLDHEEERAARRELSLLQDLSAEEGETAVIKTIARRARVGDSEVIFALKGEDGRLYGDAESWPGVQRDDGAWGPLEVDRDGKPVRAVGLLSLLPDGSIVLIGNDFSGRDRVRGASLAGLALALGLVTALAFAFGAQINRVGRMRVAAISRTAEEVMAGRLAARVPVERERDVFDHLGRVVNQMLDRLEALFAAMRAVTDSLAHDLRTPLNRLKAALERAALASNGEAAVEIERAQNEADRLASTFSSLIDIARAESGLSEEAMEVVDLKTLTEGLVDLFLPAAEDRGIRMAVSAPELSLRAHRPLLSQAIANLIDNAIKYAPPGGTISVELLHTEEGAEIVVADSGPGIPAESRVAAQTRLVRLNPTDQAGAGLGLSIAAATARLHRGELTLHDNQPGLRATLSLRTARQKS